MTLAQAFSWRKSTVDAGVLILLAAGLALLSVWFHPQMPEWSATRPVVQEVIAAAVEKWDKPPLWVDARATTNYEQRHIPGAISLNETAWERLLRGFLSQWQPNSRIVVYCDSQSCDASRSVALRLQSELKLKEIYVLKGGWQEWQQTHP